MLRTGGAEDDASGVERSRLGVDAEIADPFEHVVDLVGPPVAMAGLALTGLERVDVAEETLAREERVLLHLVRGELTRVGDSPKNLHRGSIGAARGGWQLAAYLSASPSLTLGNRTAIAALGGQRDVTERLGAANYTAGPEGLLSDSVIVTQVEKAIGWARKYSIFPYPFATACCAMEFMSLSMAPYDIDRFGAALPRFTPRQADLLIVIGTVTIRQAPILRRVYDQMAEPKWVMSFGACASSGGFYDNYTTLPGIDRVIPVDVYVPGCPPRPEAVLDGLMMLQKKIQNERQRAFRREVVDPDPNRSGSGLLPGPMSELVLLRHRGISNYHTLDVYEADGGYEAPRKALTTTPAGEVVDDGEEVGPSRPRRRRLSRPASSGASSRRRTASRVPRASTPTRASPARSRTAQIIEHDPHQLLEGMHHRAPTRSGHTRVHLHSRRVPFGAEVLEAAIAEALRARATSARTSSAAASTSTSRPSRRRRLHLRRRDRPHRVARGQARLAARQAAVPRRLRRLRLPDDREQRRDARVRAAHRQPRRRVVQRDRPREVPGRSSTASPAT